MKLFAHMLVVSSVLFGGDVFFNNGNETRSLMFDSRVAVTSGVRMQVYHISTFVERKVDKLLPGN
jgi:hypothetical protein